MKQLTIYWNLPSYGKPLLRHEAEFLVDAMLETAAKWENDKLVNHRIEARRCFAVAEMWDLTKRFELN